MYGGLDSNWKAHQDTWKLKFATNEWKWEQLSDGPEAKLTYSADSVGQLVLVFVLGGREHYGGKNTMSMVWHPYEGWKTAASNPL